MTDRMERFVVLPFSIGCASQSSVAVVQDRKRRAQPDHTAGLPSPPTDGRSRQGPGLVVAAGDKMIGPVKKPFGFGSVDLSLPTPTNVSSGLQKLIKNFGGFIGFRLSSGEQQQEEEEEMEMEIGLPTDVQHVGHIGWDWDRLRST